MTKDAKTMRNKLKLLFRPVEVLSMRLIKPKATILGGVLSVGACIWDVAPVSGLLRRVFLLTISTFDCRSPCIGLSLVERPNLFSIHRRRSRPLRHQLTCGTQSQSLKMRML